MSGWSSEVIYTVTVERRKITHYLLNLNSEAGAGKAKFFLSCGFVAAEPEGLERALAAQLIHADSIKHLKDPLGFGDKLVADGRIATPIGIRPMIRTIWMWTPASERGPQRDDLANALRNRLSLSRPRRDVDRPLRRVRLMHAADTYKSSRYVCR